jgi:hypothetical protein
MKHLLAKTLTLIALLSCSVLAADDLVFSAVSNGTNYFSSGVEYGNEVDLAGTSRRVSELLIGYFGDFKATPNASFTVRLYANDGPVEGFQTPEGPVHLNAPGSLLWQSGSFAALPGYQGALVSVPTIAVPQQFTWTISFSGLAQVPGNQAGLLLADKPTVGSTLFTGDFGALPYFWAKDANPNFPGEPWCLNANLADPTQTYYFYAKIYAVPEPAAWVLGILGAAVLFVAGRRVRR